MEDWRSTNQYVASLEPDASCDGGRRTSKHENSRAHESAAKAVQAKHGDSCSATRVDPGPKINSTSFGLKAEPPALPCRDDVLVENGNASSKSCLPSLEMCSPSAVAGLLPTGETSTATKMTFNRPPLRPYPTEEINLRTTAQPVSYDSSFWNLLAASSCRRVIEIKPGQNGTFDPGDSQGRLAPAYVWERGARCFVASLCVWGGLVTSCSAFSRIDDSR